MAAIERRAELKMQPLGKNDGKPPRPAWERPATTPTRRHLLQDEPPCQHPRPRRGVRGPFHEHHQLDDHSSPSSTHSSIPSQYALQMTARLLLVVILATTAFAFGIGMAWRLVILGPHIFGQQQEDTASSVRIGGSLPHPKATKEVPQGTHMSKVFPSEAFSTSHIIHLDRTLVSEDIDDSEDASGDSDDEEEDEHLPSVQQLLIDFKNVDPHFLNSEERLAQSLIGLMEEVELTLLSYNCHSLVPIGVSCVGILAESHVAFHSWPKEGVIYFDLSTSGEDSLIGILPNIEKWFAPVRKIPGDAAKEAPETKMKWSHRLRGFRQGFSPTFKRHEHPLEEELGNFFLCRHRPEMKVPVVFAEETNFQHVDIFELRKPEGTDKILYLDGVRQSSLRGEAAYHEALVHPGMLSHPNPRRVAIIGGGEGATLREVLKHNTVEEVVMAEIDGELVEMCQEHLPEWSDCSDIAGSDADSCFEDSRATVVIEDAFKYFIDAFGGPESLREKFDLIIMDALDPDKLVPIVGSLYKDNHFVNSIFAGLSDEGVFVMQLGQTSDNADPGRGLGPDIDEDHMIEGLESIGFASIHAYDEGHALFDAPWSYLVCFKDVNSRARWYKTPAEIDLELHQRLYPTRSGKPPLLFADAPMIKSYQIPSKAEENVECRGMGAHAWECDDWLPEKFSNKTKPFCPAFERHARQILENDTQHFEALCCHHSDALKQKVPILGAHCTGKSAGGTDI